MSKVSENLRHSFLSTDTYYKFNTRGSYRTKLRGKDKYHFSKTKFALPNYYFAMTSAACRRFRAENN